MGGQESWKDDTDWRRLFLLYTTRTDRRMRTNYSGAFVCLCFDTNRENARRVTESMTVMCLCFSGTSLC